MGLLIVKLNRSLNAVIALLLSIVICGLFFTNIAISQTIGALEDEPTAEFHFARLIYSDAYSSRRARWGGGGAWSTDYPDAEYHLMEGVKRLTRVDGQSVSINSDFYGDGGRLITLNNEGVFDYPWLYAVEVGQWHLSDAEAARLREYLDRGGFLIVDDFWGEGEWSIFIQSMLRVFPDKPIVELSNDHELLHVLYDLDQRTAIPGIRGINSLHCGRQCHPV